MNEIITQIVESEDLHIYQGEFIKNVEFIEDFSEKDGKYRKEPIFTVNYGGTSIFIRRC